MPAQKVALGAKKKSNTKLLLGIFILLCVAIGIYIVKFSHASGSLTSYTQYYDASNVFHSSQSVNVKEVKADVGAQVGLNVIYMAPFGKVSFGDVACLHVCEVPGMVLSSTTQCYTMRSTDPTKPASVKLYGTDGVTTRTVTIKPSPAPTYPQDWWQTECITNGIGGKGVPFPYQVAHASGPAVLIYNQEITATYQY